MVLAWLHTLNCSSYARSPNSFQTRHVVELMELYCNVHTCKHAIYIFEGFFCESVLAAQTCCPKVGAGVATMMDYSRGLCYQRIGDMLPLYKVSSRD